MKSGEIAERIQMMTNADELTDDLCRVIYALCYRASVRGAEYDSDCEFKLFENAREEVRTRFWKWREKYETEQSLANKGANNIVAESIKTTTENCVVKPIRQPQLVRLADVEKKFVEWLIPNYIPTGMITLIAGDGGAGKGFTACNIVAGLTNGKKTLFDENITPFESNESTGICLYLSYEDDAGHVLRDRLEKAGADINKVLTLNLSDAESVYFDSPVFEKWIVEYKPILVICDPLQSFLPASVNMSARNMMRQAMSPLIKLGEKYGTTFLILMHTNKKNTVWGRSRLADSADVWDIARSVFICGFTKDGDIRYLSHEKSTHAERQDTILFHIEEGKAVYDGVTDKRDREFVIENGLLTRQSPQKEEAKERIVQKLSDGQEYSMQDLESCMRNIDISQATFRRAKEELVKEKRIKITRHGFGGQVFLSILERGIASEQV